MGVNKTLLVYIGFDILFLVCAGVLIGLPLAANVSGSSALNLSTVAQTLLVDECPLKGQSSDTDERYSSDKT